MPAITKSPPWETFYNEVVALLDGDPDIDVMRSYTEKEKKINIYVRSDKKYLLLEKYLPTEKEFGVSKVLINIIPANGNTKKPSVKEDMKALFGDNKNVSRIETQGLPGGEVTYVAFKNGVVQFFDDNLADINHNKTMLMENVARDVLKMPVDGVYFCTDKPSTEKKLKGEFSSKKVSKSDLDDMFGLFNQLL